MLEALTPWEPGDGVELRSAMDHRFRSAGATIARRGSWLVPAAVPQEEERLARVAIADASHLCKLELRGGAPPAPGADREIVTVSPGRWIVLSHPSARGSGTAELAEGRRLVADVTGAWSVLVLAGPEAPRLLRRLGPVAEIPGAGPVAGLPARLVQRSRAIWVLVAVEVAQHLFDAALDACGPFGGGPAGLDAVARATGDPLLAAEPVGAAR
jgi:glycine cleavage system aminomethyltransferase T